MPKGIFLLSDETSALSSEKKYFLDANVWIFALGNPPGSNSNFQAYLDFLDKLLENKFKIFSHTILISEVFNALMRISFEEFKNVEQIRTGTKPKLDFKRDFRGSNEYNLAFERFQSDINAYLPCIHILDTEYDFDLNYLIKNLPVSSDFNDYLYYEMALDLNLTIVTDDRDFNYTGIEILTENRALLKGF